MRAWDTSNTDPSVSDLYECCLHSETHVLKDQVTVAPSRAG